jgi:parvulin-like peptidyl-prolyl isomerase
VDQKLLYAEARATGCDNVPEVARKVRKFREGLMENMLYGKYILPDVTVTDAEVKEYYERNPGEFVFPESRNVAQILVGSPEAANEVMEKLREGQAFGSLAKAYSTDSATKDSGGVVGWFEKNKIPPALEPAVWALKPGEVGGPVKTEAGYHILTVVEIRPDRPKEFPVAKKEIEKKLRLKKSEEKVQFWLQKLKAVSQIEIREPL